MDNNNQGSLNIASFFDNAVNSNTLSAEDANDILGGLDTTAQFGAFGTDINDLDSDQVILLTLVIDASGSMGTVQQDVIDGFNLCTHALLKAKSIDDVLVSAWVFNHASNVLFNWKKVGDVRPLTKAEYAPSGATALYQTVLNSLTSTAAYADNLRRSGMRVRTVYAVLTDGGDTEGGVSPNTISTLAQTLIDKETYTLVYFGFGPDAMMTKIGKDMGFPTIKTTSRMTEKEIREVFELVSGSVYSMSQNVAKNNANAFFGNP